MMVLLIVIPLAAGVLVLLTPSGSRGVKEGIALLASLVTLALGIALFLERPLEWSAAGVKLLRLDGLNAFIIPAAGLFGVLIVLYSVRFMAGKPHRKDYYSCLLFTLGASCGVLLADHLILLLIFWGLVGFTLYLLVSAGGSPAAAPAKKTFIIVGGSDALLLLGLGIIWLKSGSWELSGIALPLRGLVSIAAFLCLAVAAFAKAGAMPFHTWIPACAEPAPVPVVAFLPAAIDKLLGIYLLARISLETFRFASGSAISIFLMIVGAMTVVAAVMMALIQHDMKRLLSYHAVSQVGYMVLGIGTGIPLGIAGGIFHMLNHAIYKSCLFLTSGAVEFKKGTTDLDRLGGLARVMPISFACFIIAALAISGVPPLNGFFSKWMIYQGIINTKNSVGIAGGLWPLWLLAAMFGSALTLASFMKLLHAVFLGSGEDSRSRDEVPGSMWIPMSVLALLCVVLGILAYPLAIKGFLGGAIPDLGAAAGWPGWWKPGLATALILIGLAVGWIVYRLGNLKGMRTDESYIGGEKLFPPPNRVTGTEFYRTISEMSPFKQLYKLAGEKYFDIYDLGSKLTFWISDRLKALHGGVLPVYLSWCLLGIVVFLIILMRQQW